MRSPLSEFITKLRVNKTLHGRSVYRKKDVPGHNVFQGYNSFDGDAVDLFALAGTPVIAMESGRVTECVDEGPKSRLKVVGEYSIMYAHINVKDIIHVGSEITEGQVIGYIGKEIKDPHLHLELRKNGVSISASTAKGLVKKISSLCN